MRDRDAYPDALSISDVPWNRLGSSYGWAGEFPALLECIASGSDDEALNAVRTLGSEMEHQGTLWPCTPFALVFLVRELKGIAAQPESERAGSVARGILDVLENMAEVCADALAMLHADPLPRFSDMLEEAFLIPANIQSGDVEPLIKDGFGFSDELFFSFYHYSHHVLSSAEEVCKELARSGTYPAAAGFLKALSRCGES